MNVQHGWMCPQCGKAHAPSVVTCPEGLPPLVPFTFQSTPDCGCKPGTVCMNVACPRRPQVTA